MSTDNICTCTENTPLILETDVTNSTYDYRYLPPSERTSLAVINTAAPPFHP